MNALCVGCIAIVSVLVAGCHRGPQLTRQIDAIGGVSALKVGCATYLQYVETNFEEGRWKGWNADTSTNRPPGIPAFVDAVTVEKFEGIVFLKMEVYHPDQSRFLFVTVDPVGNGYMFRPASGQTWRIADGVYEYIH
jgi:hypothetical protein